MKLLLIADEEDPYLWEHYEPERLKDIDLILSGGDLKGEYLSFLVTMGHAPVFYVHGNHDGRYYYKPPEGCVCIEDRVVTYQGLRILGLGGSALYNGGPHQYTERAMKWRLWKVLPQIWRAGGVDIVVTHAPVRGYGDLEDDAVHRGFEVFRTWIDRWKPKYWIHGHVHLCYGPNIPRMVQYGQTSIINACGHYVLELPEDFMR